MNRAIQPPQWTLTGIAGGKGGSLSSYVEQSLGQGESIRYSAALSLWGYVFNFVVGVVLLALTLPGLAASLKSQGSMHGPFETIMAILVLTGLGIFFLPFLTRKSTEMVVTDKRVIAKFGLISTRSIEIRLDKIETVRVQQGLLGKLCNFGDIMITGTGTTFDPIPKIARPLAFRNALNDAMEQRASASPRAGAELQR